MKHPLLAKEKQIHCNGTSTNESGGKEKNIHYAFANCADGLKIPKQSELHKKVAE